MKITLKNSRKAKKLKLSVQPGGLVVVTKPFFISKKSVFKFINEQKAWIEKNINKQKNVKSLKSKREDYLKYKEESRRIISLKIEEINKFYKFNFKNVSIKNQRTRWGSCSSLGNLSFNWQVAKLPGELTNYIIVHELCHLKEMNHSFRFWNLVSRYIPNYKNLRKKLIKDGISLA